MIRKDFIQPLPFFITMRNKYDV